MQRATERQVRSLERRFPRFHVVNPFVDAEGRLNYRLEPREIRRGRRKRVVEEEEDGDGVNGEGAEREEP